MQFKITATQKQRLNQLARAGDLRTICADIARSAVGAFTGGLTTAESRELKDAVLAAAFETDARGKIPKADIESFDERLRAAWSRALKDASITVLKNDGTKKPTGKTKAEEPLNGAKDAKDAKPVKMPSGEALASAYFADALARSNGIAFLAEQLESEATEGAWSETARKKLMDAVQLLKARNK